jgi:hypothetical protein
MLVLDSINTTLTTLNTDINDLLGKASREQLLPVYSEAKGLVCCMMPDAFASMWMGLTFAGECWYKSGCSALPLFWLLVHMRPGKLICSAASCRLHVHSGWVHLCHKHRC